ncbi:sirohydrochlorin chelatase [Synechococcus sp. HK05]|uniref:sirohydrochlorin chelatase n=1 Tax=Synechococcus sp. HK05 TaxID=2725975 RepID=UPI001C395C33|nr:sirohydrochlorin chelatase [Synechococcus sp. HK05]MBV2351228.1 sirohydrochlorin chelatase [Synechococcus sp. HK05]
MSNPAPQLHVDAGLSAIEGGPIGVLICGHGSRNRQAVGEFAQLAEGLRSKLPGVPVEYGYLEFARPILRDGLESLQAQGVKRVLAVPGMLFAAGHAKNDIPSVLNTFSAESGLRIDYGRELGVDLSMIQAAGARIREALNASDAAAVGRGEAPVPLSDTLLVVVGRGSSDPDANSNVSKVARMLVEGFGFGWGETVYSGVTFPLVEPGLRHAVKLGFRRIVVFPYFLFSGVLVSRIRQHTQLVASDHPELEFVEASYLGDHPLVINTFLERVQEVVRGETQMNCSLCKYRAQVLGFETEVGAPQQSHHHHVEGLVEACTLCEHECTGACQPDGIPIPLGHSHGHDHSHDHGHHDHAHDHGHTHAPYPHADHPLGPRTLYKPRPKPEDNRGV